MKYLALPIVALAGFLAFPLSAFDLVSVDSLGMQGDQYSFEPSLSQDGSRVVFLTGSQLVPEDTDMHADVYLHDRNTGTTTLVSIGIDGLSANFQCRRPMISADGNFVVFVSRASNLVDLISTTQFNVYLRDLEGETTTLISQNASREELNAYNDTPSISMDGSRIVFASAASNAPTGGGGFAHIYLSEGGSLTRISVDENSTDGNGNSYDCAISADGNFVAFYSEATNLVDGETDLNDEGDIFRKNLSNGEVVRVSADENKNDSDGESRTPFLNATGRYVSFRSSATDLIGNDTNDHEDLFVHDVDTLLTTRVSVDANGEPIPDGILRLTSILGGWISGDGTKVCFVTNAFTPGTGLDDSRFHIYEYDFTTGVSRIVNRTHTGSLPNDSVSQGDGAISLDGNHIAYGSGATDISYTDANGNVADIFVSPGTPRKVAGDPFAALRAQLANKIKKLKKKAKNAKRKGKAAKAKKLKKKVRKLSQRLNSL